MTNVEGEFLPTPGDPPKPLRLERRRVWQSVFLAAVIFVAGGASGWGLAVTMRPPPPPPGGGPMGMRPDPPVDEVVKHLRDELLLNPTQVTQVTEIYKKRFEALKAAREEMAPKLKTEYTQLRADIEKVLTPEQFAAWDKRFDAARNRMFPPPPGGPGGPRNGPPPREGEGMFPPPGNGPDGMGPPGGDGPRNGPGPGRRPPPPPNGGDGSRPGDGQGPPDGPGMPPGPRPGN